MMPSVALLQCGILIDISVRLYRSGYLLGVAELIAGLPKTSSL